MRWLALLAFVVLAACGVNGEPEPVEGGGVAVSGEARIGVTGAL